MSYDCRRSPARSLSSNEAHPSGLEAIALMRLSDRYAMREAISPFLFGIAAFTAIFVASDIVFKVADLVASGSAGLADVIMLLLYKLPYVATLTFPMAMLLGSLLGMARLSSTHELVAFRACGLSIARLTLPILVFSFFVFLFSLFVGEALVPRAARAEFELTNRILNRTEAWLQGDDLVQQRKTASGLELVHIGRLRDELISDVVVVEIKDSGEVTITRAKRRFGTAAVGHYGMGSTVVVSPDGLSRVVPPELDEIIPSTAMTFEEYRKLPLEDSPQPCQPLRRTRPESMITTS